MVSLLIWLSRTLKVGCQRSEDCYLLWPVLKVDHWGVREHFSRSSADRSSMRT